MPRKKRSYPAELKVKVVLEVLREEATMAELAARIVLGRPPAPATVRMPLLPCGQPARRCRA